MPAWCVGVFYPEFIPIGYRNAHEIVKYSKHIL